MNGPGMKYSRQGFLGLLARRSTCEGFQMPCVEQRNLFSPIHVAGLAYTLTPADQGMR